MTIAEWGLHWFWFIDCLKCLDCPAGMKLLQYPPAQELSSLTALTSCLLSCKFGLFLISLILTLCTLFPL